MTPTYQTIFGFPRGNCQAACLASIFDVPLGTIPDDPDIEWDSRYSLHVEWLRAQGIYMLNFPGPVPYNLPGYLIASLPSQNHEGKNHAVVWKGGQIVHDPNPNNAPYVDLVPLEFTCFCLIDPGQKEAALRQSVEECERLRSWKDKPDSAGDWVVVYDVNGKQYKRLIEINRVTAEEIGTGREGLYLNQVPSVHVDDLKPSKWLKVEFPSTPSEDTLKEGEHA